MTEDDKPQEGVLPTTSAGNPPPAPDKSLRRFFGGVSLVAGFLFVAAGGLCCLFSLGDLARNSHDEYGIAKLAVIGSAITIAVGVGLIKLGRISRR